MEPDKSYPTFGHQLLQLDLATLLCAELQQQGRAELTDYSWTWNDIASYPTLL